MTLESLKNKLFIASFGIGLASTIGIFNSDPNIKQLGTFTLGCAVSGVVLGEVLTGKCHGAVNKSKSEVETLIQGKEDEIKALNKQILDARTALKTLEPFHEQLKLELASAHQLLKERNAALLVTNAEVAKLQNNLRDVGKFSTSEAHQIVRRTYERSVKKLECHLDALHRNFPDVQSDLDGLYIEVDSLRNRYLKRLEEYEALETFNELLDIGLEFQEKIIERCIDLRVKAQSVVIKFLSSIVDDSVPFESYEQHITNLSNAAGEQIKQAQVQREADVKAIASEWVVSNQGWEQRYNSNFEEMLQSAKEAVTRLQERETQLEQLQQVLAEAQKPLLLPGQTEQARIGNAIASYYFNLGYTLDCLDWQQTDTGYKLTFSTSRNGQRFITSEMLNDKEMGLPEKLKELSSALSLPKFERSERGGHWLVDIQKWHPVKTKPAEKDISKLWVSASKFEQTVKGWSRIRITGGSESGKSPTAENLAVCILKNRPGVGKLYNPQHDSVKNYWTVPVVGTSHKDSEKAIALLAKQVDARSSGQEPRESFEISIFDEIDSTMSHTNGKKSEIGGDVNFIIKQASHQNLGAIFIGQNANVSEYPGMDRSDWNNAVNLHIGFNCYDAITNSNLFTTEEVTRLKGVADKLTEHCSIKNEELGLDKTDPSAYRFAFVVEPGKKPYFIELPSFGAFTYDHDAATATDVKKDTFSSDAGVRTDIAIKCKHCGSDNVRRNGKDAKGAQYYNCMDCKKTPRKWIM
jgi:InsA N-terminal domain